jgi:hypothetical protein
MDIDTLLTEMARQGRNAGPMLLNKYWPELNTDDRKAALLDTWVMAEWPEQAMPWQIWLHYFKQAGFISDNLNIEKPRQPLTIYRGAVKHKRKGMSWTQDKELAAWFANRFNDDSSKGFLYQAIIEPDYILAIITGVNGRQGESEVIINPEGLNNIKRLEL